MVLNWIKHKNNLNKLFKKSIKNQQSNSDVYLQIKIMYSYTEVCIFQIHLERIYNFYLFVPRLKGLIILSWMVPYITPFTQGSSTCSPSCTATSFIEVKVVYKQDSGSYIFKTDSIACIFNPPHVQGNPLLRLFTPLVMIKGGE